ncbi:hypothetical protein STCU_05291 [Strigomonas culicis]|uniref:Protein SEY1 homolog n=1 Tax=Strigomonas culicis TaxID=28005 RepID=S9V0J2_9TRYP|nr:hypothetical protein STCU_09497 [Strigomonas culicis]EPY20431.1 hypothetical protein STCU_08998 [Strigomonas culicis]EPY28120.1 hypothetical protein STCU_05291 [Strigomonas culicis]|eukprot:EPY19363.1 hypothetical protein STCU_09497 [Strigomonas culicis]
MSLHLIDNDGRLQSEKGLVEFLTKILSDKNAKKEDIMRKVGVNYHIVGVFGGQSSGKSTLLNHLFGTDFQVLDERVRRGQTTKGAFLSNANENLEGFEKPSGKAGKPGADASKAPLLVVDFEGTDGLERGEDQSFERQLSLFGLSAADTLIINMWAVDVGRFNAANLSLLRTIFEVNLQLFSHDSYKEEERPTLLIVLRDFTEEDTKPSLTTVRKSFDTIWDNITRPPKFAGAKIDALFDLKYYVMPHYKLQKPEFNKSLVELRRWFGDDRCKDYLFRHQAMFRGVPLDGLPPYLTSCWEAILTSKDLDIPTQREMLAQHRCKTAMEEELHVFLDFIHRFEERINKGEMLLRLSEQMDKEMAARVEAFQQQTRLYNQDVVKTFSEELVQEMGNAVMKVVQRFSKAIAAEVLVGLETRVQSALADSVRHLLRAAQTQPFSTAPPPPEEEDDDIFELRSTQPAATQPSRFTMDNTACQHLVRKFWKNMRRSLNELLGELSTNPPPANLFGRYTSLVAQDSTARDNVVSEVTEAVFNKVRSRIGSMAESAAETMHRAYEKGLTHNEDGTVRFFSTVKGLEKTIPEAQQASLVLLGCLLYFRLELAPAAARDASASASTTTESACVTAQRVRDAKKVIAFRDGLYDRQFQLTFTTIDHVPRYPSNVEIAPEPTDEQLEKKAELTGVDPSCVLLSQAALEHAYDLFRQNADFTTQMQLRTIESTKQKLPAWVPFALLVLGWNEIMYLITSPSLLIIVGVIVYLFFRNYIISQWQAFEESGPASIVIPLQTALRQGIDLYNSVAPPDMALPQVTTTTTAVPPPGYADRDRDLSTPLHPVSTPVQQSSFAQPSPAAARPAHTDPARITRPRTSSVSVSKDTSSSVRHRSRAAKKDE